MRNTLSRVIFFCALLLTTQIMAHRVEEFEVDVDVGYRYDYLRWSIAGLNGHPNTLSELVYKDMRSYQVGGHFRYTNCYNYYFKGSGDYGRIFRGKFTDSDFLGDDHTLPFSISHGKADRGDVYDLSGGIGYKFRFLIDRVTITPVGGYSYHRQFIKMRDLYIDLDLNGMCGPVPCLNSNYRTQWYGPWLGADFTLRMTGCWTLIAEGEFHWARYRAKGHWNLRPEFVSDFKQKANGWGQVYNLGFNYDLACQWDVGILGNYQIWKTETGNDRIYVAAPCPIPINSRLNTVRWRSWSVNAYIAYYF